MNRFQSWYSMQPPALRAILTINVVTYLLWQLIFIHFDAARVFVWTHLLLHAEVGTVLLQPWQLVTYNFLHTSPGFMGFIHILFNMLWLYWIGREYEELHGPHRLLAVYLIAGIGGGLLTVLLHVLFPGVAAFGGPVDGASASVLGVLMTVAILYPFKSIALIFLGTIRLLYVVLGFLAIDILLMAGSNTSVSAHLGGALFGFLFAKAEQGGVDLSSWARFFFRGRDRDRRSRNKTRARNRDEGFLKRIEGWLADRNERKGERESGSGSSKPSFTARSMRRPSTPVEVAEPSLENEVDRILDKISAQGYEALTEEEKRILYEASRR